MIVGETTRGGAHPREGWTVHPHLEATVPVGRSVNPVSGTDWEGTGVRPDIPCPAAEALDRAREAAPAPETVHRVWTESAGCRWRVARSTA